jgi:hypothetical protein
MPYETCRAILNRAPSHFVTFGALITILAIAIDPFTQQIVHPVLCYRKVLDSVASIPRANGFRGMGVHTGGGMAALDPGISAAIYAGLLNSSQTVGFQCETGNCTFPAMAKTGESYQTAGIDFGCVDISKEVKQLDKYNWYVPQLGDNSTTVNGGPNITRTSSSYTQNAFQEYWPITSGDKQFTLLRFELLTLTIDWDCVAAANTTYAPCLKPFAAQCRLWPAVLTVGSQIELGKLQESTLSSQSINLGNLQAPSIAAILVSTEVLRNGSWQTCKPSSTNSSDTPVPIFNGTIWQPSSSTKDPVVLEWYAQDCVWTMDYVAALALKTELYNFFAQKRLVAMYGISTARASYGDLWIKSLFHNGTANMSTVEMFVGQLARSMTAYTRQNPMRDLRLGYVYGDAIRTEACVRVRWAWISFPASLVLLSICFLAVTMWRTRMAGLKTLGKGAWKSSSLAVLFAGLDERDRQEYGRLNKKSEMLSAAEENKVALARTEDGWRLTGSGDGL